mmetsp:Transcript_145107/g.463595  ORF Transcript_145107/g.463595 Transcript_145107/m.463595 type:complete len:211 (+) Transcript_145107:929-1561(+)
MVDSEKLAEVQTLFSHCGGLATHRAPASEAHRRSLAQHVAVPGFRRGQLAHGLPVPENMARASRGHQACAWFRGVLGQGDRAGLAVDPCDERVHGQGNLDSDRTGRCAGLQSVGRQTAGCESYQRADAGRIDPGLRHAQRILARSLARLADAAIGTARHTIPVLRVRQILQGGGSLGPDAALRPRRALKTLRAMASHGGRCASTRRIALE